MKAVTVKQLKTELQHRSEKDLIDICLTLAKFKKETKELLTYLLFEADDETGYINSVKEEIDLQFNLINLKSVFYIKKSVRKILRLTKKYIRYSKNKETEIELLLYFCMKIRDFTPSILKNRVLYNIYDRELNAIRKKILLLHEDLQYDYTRELEQFD
ncbi:hypothetical protein [Ascidiimonas sp. W6]|uniref:hypothetical protein n=1 Tax=Ascidiimonas meishanensis TaxID=3128903 RepID=UPI0030ED36C3